MAQKPYIIDHQRREQRQQSYMAAPVVGKKFPGIEQLAVEMRFKDPEGKSSVSPHRRLFAPDMQAFFEFQCPLRDCANGGFNLTSAVPKAFSDRKHETTGTMECEGRRPRDGAADPRCRLELQYRVTMVEEPKVVKAVAKAVVKTVVKTKTKARATA
jgi:hypothetical protein